MIAKDSELQALLEQPNAPLVSDFKTPADWDSKDSLVQPCSLDLSIGGIYEPGVRPGGSGSSGNPKSELVLRTGRTAIVTTRETLKIPANYAAFGFPPSHVSVRGLLLANPGHVDPGYEGKLRFTVINMGKEDFILQSGGPIVTLLIFGLGSPARADYAARRGGSPPASSEPSQNDIDRLAPDFVDVSRRAKKIARTTLAVATLLASIVALIVGGIFNIINNRMDGIDELKLQLSRLHDENKLLAVELRSDSAALQKEIDIEHRISALENSSATRLKEKQRGQK